MRTVCRVREISGRYKFGEEIALSKDGEGVHAPAPGSPLGRPSASAFTRKLGGAGPCSTAEAANRPKLQPPVRLHGTKVPCWRQAAHACGPNPLTFPTHGLGRAGIYRLPMAQSAAVAVCCCATAATSGFMHVPQPGLPHERCCSLLLRQRRYQRLQAFAAAGAAARVLLPSAAAAQRMSCRRTRG